MVTGRDISRKVEADGAMTRGWSEDDDADGDQPDRVQLAAAGRAVLGADRGRVAALRLVVEVEDARRAGEES